MLYKNSPGSARVSSVLLVTLLAVALTGCAIKGMRSPMRSASDKTEATDQAIEDSYSQLGRTERAIADRWRGQTFEAFLATVYREPDNGKYIVNGDTPIADIKHLREFYEQRILKPIRPQARLAVMSTGGVDAVWGDTEKRSLTYCVSNAFGSRYNTVVAAMASATGAWESVADIDFLHSGAQDQNCNAANSQVLFDVRPVSGGNYLARAFFPGDPRSQRNVLIDGSSFGLDPNENLSLEGILRHELGHVLGFRHEHTRPEAGVCFEDDNWRPLTDYDAFSTMHYPQCNGAGDWRLELTSRDQSGAACLYGSAPGFTIDTGICTPEQEPPPPTCACGEQTITESGSVARGARDTFGPISVAAGTSFTVQMTGTGDPDLYVRFGLPPETVFGRYDCRPYLSGAAESCELTVPTGATNAFIMVHGYTAGVYQLNITHTPNP